MVVLWLYTRQVISRCPGWHNEVKPKSVAYRTDHKSDEVPVAYTDEVDMKDESREAVGPADGAWEVSDWKN